MLPEPLYEEIDPFEKWLMELASDMLFNPEKYEKAFDIENVQLSKSAI
jgi:hypothetical protein